MMTQGCVIEDAILTTDEENQESLDAEMQAVMEFAVRAHSGQFRKGNRLPYIVHPMAVLAQLADWEVGCYKCWKAALCHDVLEDCPHIDFATLSSAIGEDSARIVQELTFQPDPFSDIPAHVQKRDYMKTFATSSVEALVIKVADRICNTKDFLSTNPDYAPKYWRKAEELFDSMMTRGEEINASFNRSVFPRMKYTRTTLTPMLVR